MKLRIKQRGGSALLILVDNPCLTPVVFDGDMPLSSKRKGAGIGTYSVREIAVRYGGTAQFEQKAGVFYASVLLNIVPDVTGKEAPAGNVCLSK
ncbi:GHKL domain-containing protein [Blautia coccoides]|uniref:GHKL domain-containing protein n=1 Tax=Blautia producta TaxID=33035 RepID=UPI002109A9C8|nr:GHKL domain-containing protein [Blautia coccoides]